MTSLLCSDHLNQNLLSWRNMQHSFFLNISQVNENFLSYFDLIQPFHLCIFCLKLLISSIIHLFCTLPRVLQLGQSIIIENKEILLGCLPYIIIQSHAKSQNKSKIICCNIICNDHFPDNHQLIQPQHNKTIPGRLCGKIVF